MSSSNANSPLYPASCSRRTVSASVGSRIPRKKTVNRMISGIASDPGVRPPSREVAVPTANSQQTEHEVGDESEQRPPPVLAAAGTALEGRVLLEAPLDGIHEADAVVRQVEGRWRRLSRAGGVGLVAHDGAVPSNPGVLTEL